MENRVGKLEADKTEYKIKIFAIETILKHNSSFGLQAVASDCIKFKGLNPNLQIKSRFSKDAKGLQ